MEKIMIIDTETTNTLDDPIVYDIGFMICDFDGNIYSKHSFVNADVFCDKELMESAYFKEKIPTYWEQIKKGERTLTSFNNIKWTLRHIMKENEVTKVFAYNCRFDYISLATTQRYITSSKWRYFFPYGTEFHDILALSRQHSISLIKISQRNTPHLQIVKLSTKFCSSVESQAVLTLKQRCGNHIFVYALRCIFMRGRAHFCTVKHKRIVRKKVLDFFIKINYNIYRKGKRGIDNDNFCSNLSK